MLTKRVFKHPEHHCIGYIVFKFQKKKEEKEEDEEEEKTVIEESEEEMSIMEEKSVIEENHVDEKKKVGICWYLLCILVYITVHSTFFRHIYIGIVHNIARS